MYKVPLEILQQCKDNLKSYYIDLEIEVALYAASKQMKEEHDSINLKIKEIKNLIKLLQDNYQVE